MSLEQFVNLARNVKEANNIEIGLLERLYDSMTTNEMKLCDDDITSSWDLLIKRARSGLIKYIDTRKIKRNRANVDILNIVFNPMIASFSVIFDVIKQMKEHQERNRNFIKTFIPNWILSFIVVFTS